MSLEDADSPYRNAMLALPTALRQSLNRTVEQGPLPLDGLEVTRALLLRMSAFYQAQAESDRLLGKKVRSAAADFFVESLAFYLHALIATHGLDAEVAVERVLERKRGAMRPDISLWRKDRCLASIECKTQLGWNRGGWETQFLAREQRLLEVHSGAPSFLVVLTGSNWAGFGDNPHLGVKYFLLLTQTWPTNLDIKYLAPAVGTPVEQLFARLVELIRTI